MAAENSLVASLPGSETVSLGKKEVSNHVLMPLADPLKFTASKANSAPPPNAQQLGSGSKIPESYDSRMLSQFSTPDPAIYEPKKQYSSAVSQQNGWWRDESRQSSIGCAPYKSDYGSHGKDSSGKGDKSPEVIAKEKKTAAREKQKLMQQKDYLISSFCNGPDAVAGSDVGRRMIGQVSDINRKLGLPPGDFGHWNVMGIMNYGKQR